MYHFARVLYRSSRTRPDKPVRMDTPASTDDGTP
jgi:hypothetical protein